MILIKPDAGVAAPVAVGAAVREDIKQINLPLAEPAVTVVPPAGALAPLPPSYGMSLTYLASTSRVPPRVAEIAIAVAPPVVVVVLRPYLVSESMVRVPPLIL